MYTWFATFKEAMDYINTYNSANENYMAKMVAWAHSQQKTSDKEYGVFTPRKIA